MEWIFKDQFMPGIRLIDSILILGVSTKTLRKLFHNDQLTTSPEMLFHLPPTGKQCKHIIEAVFSQPQIFLQRVSEYPSFFSTSHTHSNNRTEYLHCLKLYEKVTPTILELSKERRNPAGFMNFIKIDRETEPEAEETYYVPIILCIRTVAKYSDLFRNILGALYSQLSSISTQQEDIKNCIASVEFIKNMFFLLNDLIIPPLGIKLSFSIGTHIIKIPILSDSKLGYYESSVNILIDLLDIRNIIIVWELLLLGKSLIFLSSNDYVLYLIQHALILLMFPFKPSQLLVPLASINSISKTLGSRPFVVGLNSETCTFDEIRALSSDLNVLDIDSNTLHVVASPLLCECLRSSIGEKIQYVKSLYYVDHDRLSIYRTASLEKSIKDSEFVKKAQFLTSCEQDQKSEYFVSLVRSVFSSVFFKTLQDYSNFVVKTDLEGKVQFDKERFLAEKVEKCCKYSLDGFWAEILDSKSFREFLEYGAKKDKSLQKKFAFLSEHIKKYGESFVPEKPTYEIKILEKISNENLFDQLQNYFYMHKKDSVSNKFTVQTGNLLLNDARKLVKSANISQMSSKVAKQFLHQIEKDYFEGKTFALPNLFYGDFGIIQFLKGLIQPLTRESFRTFSVQSCIFHMTQLAVGSFPEAMAVQLAYHLTTPKRLWNSSLILDFCMKIEKSNPALIPVYPIAKVLDKELNSDRVRLEFAIDSSKMLKDLLEDIKNNPMTLLIKENLSELTLNKKSSFKKKQSYLGRHSERKCSPGPDDSIS